MKKIIVRIRGGLGNQLFCYAAARRLAIVNNVELVIDDVTGFVRDRIYGRHYMLDKFSLTARKATGIERLEPFERYRRGLAKWLARRQPFEKSRYIEQEGNDFDERLLDIKVTGTIYLDGLWQSEDYFKDVEETIRKDLRLTPPSDEKNLRFAEEIQSKLAVAIHVRWFDKPTDVGPHNVAADYYRRAVAIMEGRLSTPSYFVFSDNPEAVYTLLSLPISRTTFVSHNQGDENACADLWLMTHCNHFITANSTFSWWGAWLGEEKEKIVVTPSVKIVGKTSWGFKGLIPREWVPV